MAISQADAETFFARYVQTLLAQDLAGIARHWGVPGLVLNDQGARPIGSSAEIEAFFASVLKDYAHLTYATFSLREAEPMSETVLRAVVEWAHFDVSGTVVGRETSQYMLRKDGDDVRIVVHTPKLR